MRCAYKTLLKANIDLQEQQTLAEKTVDNVRTTNAQELTRKQNSILESKNVTVDWSNGNTFGAVKVDVPSKSAFWSKGSLEVNWTVYSVSFPVTLFWPALYPKAVFWPWPFEAASKLFTL